MVTNPAEVREQVVGRAGKAAGSPCPDTGCGVGEKEQGSRVTPRVSVLILYPATVMKALLVPTVFQLIPKDFLYRR